MEIQKLLDYAQVSSEHHKKITAVTCYPQSLSILVTGRAERLQWFVVTLQSPELVINNETSYRVLVKTGATAG